MKPVKFLALILVTCTVTLAQKPVAPYKVYKSIDYQNIFRTRTTYDTIKESGIVDIFRFQKHFYYPTLPAVLKNDRYKNQTVVVWANPDTVKYPPFKTNSNHSFKYDSLSRVIRFTGSGCMVCSWLPSSHSITYNKQGLVETVVKTEMGRDTCKFQYDAQGNITRFDYYNGMGLSKSIIKQ